jgi:hypothetical protein
VRERGREAPRMRSSGGWQGAPCLKPVPLQAFPQPSLVHSLHEPHTSLALPPHVSAAVRGVTVGCVFCHFSGTPGLPGAPCSCKHQVSGVLWCLCCGAVDVGRGPAAAVAVGLAVRGGLPEFNPCGRPVLRLLWVTAFTLVLSGAGHPVKGVVSQQRPAAGRLSWCWCCVQQAARQLVGSTGPGSCLSQDPWAITCSSVRPCSRRPHTAAKARV